MKTITWKLVMCIVMMLGTFTFTSCGDDENDDEEIIEGGGTYSDLFGTWRMVYMDMETYKDGQLHDSQKGDIDEGDAALGEFKEGDVYVGTYDGISVQGKWSYKNGKITISVKDPESGKEDVEVGTIKKLTKTELVIEISSEETEDGSLYQYHSIQSYIKVK